MKILMKYDSLKVHSGTFSLKEFIESDAPGTLSWLNMDLHELNNDRYSLKEAQRSPIAIPCDTFRTRILGVPILAEELEHLNQKDELPCGENGAGSFTPIPTHQCYCFDPIYFMD